MTDTKNNGSNFYSNCLSTGQLKKRGGKVRKSIVSYKNIKSSTVIRKCKSKNDTDKDCKPNVRSKQKNSVTANTKTHGQVTSY